MAENKYTGNSSAYGYGSFLKEMGHGGLLDPKDTYKNSLHNPIVSSQAKPPSTPQVSQLAMGSGSDPRGNANDMYKSAITKGNQAPVMPNITSSTTLKTASTPGYSQNNFDLPDFTNQGYGPKEFGSVGRAYSEEDVDILKQMSGARDDFERRKRSISGPDSMYSASVQPSSGSSNLSYDPVAMGESFDGRTRNSFASYDSGKRYENDATERRYTGDKSYYQANVQPSSGPDPVYSGKESQSFDGGDYRPNWGEEKVDLDKFTSYDTKKRYDNTDAQIENNLSEGVAFRDGTPINEFMQDKPSLEMRGVGDVAGIDAKYDLDESIANLDLQEVTGSLSLGDKIGKGLSTAKKTWDKAAPAIGALTTIGTGLSEMNARSGLIDDLQGSVGKMEGMIGSLANQDYAQEEAMLDEYTEKNRRIGAAQNLQLGDKLDSVRGSNINTGSIKRIKEDITKDFGTRTDLNLASAADSYSKQVAEHTMESRENRAKMNEQLTELRDQLKEEQRKQKMAPLKMVGDLAIGAVGASNPLLAMGLGMANENLLG